MARTSLQIRVCLSSFFAGEAPGGYCQWVLDVVRETVEWSYQPLGFNSLALRITLDQSPIEFYDTISVVSRAASDVDSTQAKAPA
jgi:hypothetical protein